jgi:MFS family permease
VLSGPLGRLMVAIAAFEFGNVAVTLFILRATQLLGPGRSHTAAVQVALGLYVVYNVAATLVSVPAGRIGDRGGSTMVLATGITLFGAAYAGFALGGPSVIALAPAFLLAGIAIGCVETSQNAAVAAVAPRALRGSAFGVFAGIQSFGNLAASAVAGLLWTAISPAAAFAYLAGWMVVALVALFGALPRTRRPVTPGRRSPRSP